MKYVLTGSNGFIGANLAHRLLTMNQEVALILRPGSTNEHINKVLAFHPEGNYKRYDTAQDSLAEALTGADRVIHLATLFERGSDTETVTRLIESNITMPTLLLAKMLEVAPEASFITTSSWSAFDGENNYNPANVYSATKDAFERIGYSFPVKKAFIRMSDTYGVEDWRPKVHNLIKNAVSKNEPFTFGSPGSQTFNLSHVEDIIDGILATFEVMVNPTETLVYDFYYPENLITLAELAEVVKDRVPSAEIVFPSEGIPKKLPSQVNKIPNFVIKRPVRENLAEALFPWHKS